MAKFGPQTWKFPYALGGAKKKKKKKKKENFNQHMSFIPKAHEIFRSKFITLRCSYNLNRIF